MPDEIWTTKDGQCIAVKNMTEAHAKNALRMMLRRQKQEDVCLVSTKYDRPMSVGEQQDESDAEMRDHTGMVFNEALGYWYYP